jgi:hypothetical protein
MQNSRARNRKTEDHRGRRVDHLDRCLRQPEKYGAGKLLTGVVAKPARQRRDRDYRQMISDAPSEKAKAVASEKGSEKGKGPPTSSVGLFNAKR